MVWWAWADASGFTQRKVMQSQDARKAARREQQMEALGHIKPGTKKRR
jgi:small Trp-rich protein